MYLSFDDSSNPSLPNIYHSMLSLINPTSIFIYFDDTPIWQILNQFMNAIAKKNVSLRGKYQIYCNKLNQKIMA